MTLVSLFFHVCMCVCVCVCVCVIGGGTYILFHRFSIFF